MVVMTAESDNNGDQVQCRLPLFLRIFWCSLRRDEHFPHTLALTSSKGWICNKAQSGGLSVASIDSILWIKCHKVEWLMPPIRLLADKGWMVIYLVSMSFLLLWDAFVLQS
jgi:hypothetical protein